MLRFHHHKHATHHKHPDGKIFAWLALLLGTGNAAFWTIFPLVLEDVLGTEMLVGIYYSLVSIIQLAASLFSTILFKKYSKVWVTKVLMVISIFAFVSMTLASQIWHVAGLDIPRGICIVTINIALALFVHEYSTRKNLAVMEGRYFLFANVGWLTGPLLGGVIARYFGNENAFLVASAAYMVALVFFIHQHMLAKHPHLHHDKHKEGMGEFLASVREYFKYKELRRVFYVSLGLSYWWGISTVYIPIAVKQMGFGQDIVGLVITGGIVPLVLLEGWVGHLAQRNGVKKYLFYGFVILALSNFSFSFLGALPIILLLMFAAVNIGAAFIEPLRDTYFFEVVDQSKAGELFGIYNASKYVADITGPSTISILLLTGVPFNTVWIFAAALMTIFAVVSWGIPKKY